MIFDFFKTKHECTHPNISADTDEAYCPDCGALVKNKWYLIRCSCCNIKRIGHFEYGKIKPETKYCPNCGGSDFYIQELDTVNITDIHYALFKKVVIPQTHHSTHQLWIEKEDSTQDKILIGLHK